MTHSDRNSEPSDLPESTDASTSSRPPSIPPEDQGTAARRDGAQDGPYEGRASLQSPEPLHLDVAPICAHVTLVAAVVDLLLSKVLFVGLQGRGSVAAVEAAYRASVLPRNVVAVAGLFALVAALFDYLRQARHASMGRRLLAAAFAGIFVPTVVLATMRDISPSSLDIVLFAAGAANVLVALVAATGARAVASSAGLRVAAGMFALASFTGVLQLATKTPGLANSSLGLHLGPFALAATEVTFALVVVATALVLLMKRAKAVRDWISLGLGLGSAVAFIFASVYAKQILRADFGLVLYNATKLDRWLNEAPFAYVLLLALGVGATVTGLSSHRAWERQVGGALGLALVAGNAPKSPVRLLVFALAAMMITRASTYFANARAMAKRA